MKLKKWIILIICLFIIVFPLYIYVRVELIDEEIAVVLDVNKDYNELTVYSKNDGKEVIKIGKFQSMKFVPGQEVGIYKLTIRGKYKDTEKVIKVKRLKKISSFDLSQKDLEKLYNSNDNITVEIQELTKNGVKIVIKNKNQFIYGLTGKGQYTISKRYKQEEFSNSTENNVFVDGENTVCEVNIDWSKEYGELEERRIFFQLLYYGRKY